MKLPFIDSSIHPSNPTKRAHKHTIEHKHIHKKLLHGVKKSDFMSFSRPSHQHKHANRSEQ